MEFTRQCDIRVVEIMEHVRADAGEPLSVDVLICSDTYIPFGMGVFKRKILLPDRDYDDSDLHFILLHEYTHFINRDITIKILISVFCIMFWWNPLVYLLKKDLEQTLELKCDFTIVKWFSAREKADYLQAIVNALKDISQQRRTPSISSALLKTGREREIKERFTKVMNYRADMKRGFFNTAFPLIFVLLVTTSYVFILQPSFEVPDRINDMNIIEFGSVDSYLIKTEDGQYELFIQNESRGVITQDSADMFIEDGFPILE